MKAALSMVALTVLLGCGCTASSVAEQANVTTSARPTTRLYVRTMPPDATIRLDDGQEGTSPHMFVVPPGVSKMTVVMELDGHKPERQIVQIDGGRIIRVEFDFAQEGQPPKRRFVCLVVGKDRITFQGKRTNWGELPKLLGMVPDRAHTVLQIARAPEEMTSKHWEEAESRALRLVQRFGFEYLSDIGEHPLGSKWEETRTAPEAKAPPPTPPSTGISAESIWDGVRKPPSGWTIDGWLIVPPARTAAMEKKLGGRIKRLSNTLYSAHGQKVQVNVIEGRTEADAEKIHKAVLAMKGDPAYALRFGNTIVEFVGTFDVAFAKRAARELGLPPRPGGPSIWDRLMDRPEGWKIEQWNVRNLIGRIKKLSNATCTAHGQRVEVNVFECATLADAEKIHRDFLATKADPAYALRFDRTVVEFAGTFDVAFARRLARELELQPKPEPSTGVPTRAIWDRVMNPPEGWKVQESIILPRDQIANIEKKLGGRPVHSRRIKRLSNTVFSAHGQRVQVNVIECLTEADAEDIHKGVLATKGDPAYALRFGNTVVEFVGTFDVAFAKRAARELGLQPQPDEQAVRQVVSRFAKACVKSDKKTLANLLHEKSRHLLEQIDDMEEFVSAGMNPAEIDQVIVRGDRALAATKLTQLDHRHYPRPVSMVYILEKPGDSWVVRDVDVEDKQGLADELHRLQADAPRDESRETTAASPARVQQVEAQIESLSAALRLYRLDAGSYPTTGQNLKALLQKPVDLSDSANWQGPYLKGPVPSDPWGRRYRYQSPGRGGLGDFSVWSAGPDGVDGTDDDIGNWEPGPGPEQGATATADRAKKLKANLDSFILTLARYSSEQPQGPPAKSLVLHVPTNGFKHARAVQIDKRQAVQIIHHLAADGFLNSFHDMQDWKFIETPAGAHYTLSVRAGDAHFAQHLSWNRTMLSRLQALRKVLGGDAAEAMDQLLGPLAAAGEIPAE